MTIREMIKFLELLENNSEVVVELKIRKVAKEAPAPKAQKTQAPEKSQNQKNETKEEDKKPFKSFKELPQGVRAEKQGNRYIAVETEKGALYKNKDILKNEFGFTWNSNEKVWEKVISQK